MNNILDSETTTPNKKPYFAYTSFVFGVIVWPLSVLALFILPEKLSVGEMLALPPWLPVTLRVLFFGGLLCTIISFVRKEPSSFWKRVGTGLNVLFLLAIVGFGFYLLQKAGY